jgi:pimeloyl-ACP methyl ester carboxylesterase
VIAAIALALLAEAGEPRIVLEPCTLPGVEGAATCGHYEVFEDREARSGRKIRLFVAVLPALEQPAAPDPLFIIAGGPGQAASAIAGFANRAFAPVRRKRDIVLVDVAGTGRSGMLRCDLYPTGQALVGDMYPPERIRACREKLEQTTDLRRYMTHVLMADLDEVRAALGYETINIYGTSYGTRAAFEYLRRHGEHVRTVVMKAVVPPSLRGTMHYARDTERSLDMLMRACADDAACAGAYPHAEAEFREILARADRGELRGMVPDPGGGPAQELALSRGVVASAILGLLQNSNSAVQLPLLVHRAFRGDTAVLVDMVVSYRRAIEQGIAFGMHLSVMCSEDGARMDAAAAARNDRGTALGDYRVTQLVAACREWVRGKPPKGHGKPVVSDVPVLLVSGTLDPNTNETWGEEGLRGLSRGTHVVIPNLSHGFSSIDECGSAFMAQFIEQASMEGVDVSCKDRLKLPPFPLPGQ